MQNIIIIQNTKYNNYTKYKMQLLHKIQNAIITQNTKCDYYTKYNHHTKNKTQLLYKI